MQPKSRLSLNSSLGSLNLSRTSSNTSVTSIKSGKVSGGIQTSLRKGLPKASQFSHSKRMREPEEEESIWKGFFSSKSMLNMIDIHKYLKGYQLSDLEELKKLPGGNIWRLPSTTQLQNGKTVDVAAIRNKLLAEHFGGAQNVPEEILQEIFPTEAERKEFIEKYSKISPQKGHNLKDKLNKHNCAEKITLLQGESIVARGFDANGEEVVVKLSKKKAVIRNANGELEEITIEELVPMKKISKKILVKNSDGELKETFVQEWVPVDKTTVDVAEVIRQSQLNEIKTKNISKVERCKLLAEHFGGAENVPEDVLQEIFPDERERKEFLENYNFDAFALSEGECVVSRGIDSNGEEVVVKLSKKAVLVRNADGEFEEVVVDELVPMKKISKKVLVKTANGELKETVVEEWVAVNKASVDVSRIIKQGQLNDIKTKNVSKTERNKLLAEHFGGSENIPEEVLREMFPDEAERKEFIEQYREATISNHEEFGLLKGESIVARGFDSNGKEVVVKLCKKKIMVVNKEGVLEEVVVDELVPMRKISKKILTETADGELKETYVEEWVPVDKTTVDVAQIIRESQLDEIKTKNISNAQRKILLAEYFGGSENVPEDLLKEMFPDAKERQEFIKNYKNARAFDSGESFPLLPGEKIMGRGFDANGEEIVVKLSKKKVMVKNADGKLEETEIDELVPMKKVSKKVLIKNADGELKEAEVHEWVPVGQTSVDMSQMVKQGQVNEIQMKNIPKAERNQLLAERFGGSENVPEELLKEMFPDEKERKEFIEQYKEAKNHTLYDFALCKGESIIAKGVDSNGEEVIVKLRKKKVLIQHTNGELVETVVDEMIPMKKITKKILVKDAQGNMKETTVEEWVPVDKTTVDVAQLIRQNQLNEIKSKNISMAERKILLAEHFGGSENVPEELLMELFPDEKERKEFIEKYKDAAMFNSQEKFSLSKGETIVGRGFDSNGEEVVVKLRKKKVMVKNAEGKLEEMVIEELIPMKKIRNKVLVENSEGELTETSVEEWVPVDKNTVDLAQIMNQKQLNEITKKKTKAARNKLLAERFGGAEHVPEELLHEIFPDENERKAFLKKYKKTDENDVEEFALGQGESIVARGVDTNGEEVVVKLSKKKVLIQNAKGELEEAVVDEMVPMKKISKKILVEGSNGELIETVVEEWIPVEKSTVDVAQIIKQSQLNEIRSKSLPKEERNNLLAEHFGGARNVSKALLEEIFTDESERKEFLEKYSTCQKFALAEGETIVARGVDSNGEEVVVKLTKKKVLIQNAKGELEEAVVDEMVPMKKISKKIMVKDSNGEMKETVVEEWVPVDKDTVDVAQIIKQSQVNEIKRKKILKTKGSGHSAVRASGENLPVKYMKDANGNIIKIYAQNEDQCYLRDSGSSTPLSEKQMEQQVKEILKKHTFQNEEERKEFEAQLWEQLKMQNTFLLNRKEKKRFSTKKVNEDDGYEICEGHLSLEAEVPPYDLETEAGDAFELRMGGRSPLSRALQAISAFKSKGTPKNSALDEYGIQEYGAPNESDKPKTVKKLVKKKVKKVVKKEAKAEENLEVKQANSEETKTGESQPVKKVKKVVKTKKSEGSDPKVAVTKSISESTANTNNPASPLKMPELKNGAVFALNQLPISKKCAKMLGHEPASLTDSPTNSNLKTASPSKTELNTQNNGCNHKRKTLDQFVAETGSPRSPSYGNRVASSALSKDARSPTRSLKMSQSTTQLGRTKQGTDLNFKNNAKKACDDLSEKKKKAPGQHSEQELDFFMRNAMWQIKRRMKLMEQKHEQSEETVKNCTFSPRINSNTDKILSTARSLIDSQSERSHRQFDDCDKSQKIHSGFGSPRSNSRQSHATKSSGGFTNRPDYRFLESKDIEEEFSQRFPSLRSTIHSFRSRYLKEFEQLLAGKSNEEKEIMWKTIENAFLMVNSPEEVVKLGDQHSVAKRQKAIELLSPRSKFSKDCLSIIETKSNPTFETSCGTLNFLVSPKQIEKQPKQYFPSSNNRMSQTQGFSSRPWVQKFDK